MLLSAFCLAVATAGCSGDDGDKEKEKAGDQPSSVITGDPKDKEEKNLVAQTTKCDADVSTSGAYEADWNGDAQVRTGGKSTDDTGPRAVFSLNDKKNRLALYSPGPEFKGSISLSVGNTSYSSNPADAESFDIDKRGKSASAEATLTSISGDEIQLNAEFTCGKTKQ